MKKYKYKVIKEDTRMSALINSDSKYALRYIKGEDTYAIKETLGVMVFDTIANAEAFADSRRRNNLIVVKVLPKGRGKKLNRLSPIISDIVLDRYYSKYRCHSCLCPQGTIAYPGVHVVD